MICNLVKMKTPVRKGQAHFFACGNRERKITQLDYTHHSKCLLIFTRPSKDFLSEEVKYSWFHVFIPIKHHREHYFLMKTSLLVVNYSVVWHAHACWPCEQISLLSVMELCQLHNYSFPLCICYFHHLAVGCLWACWDSMCHRKN